MVEKINDDIDVIAGFENGNIKPLVFEWRGRRIREFEVASTWQVRQGQWVHIYFSLFNKESKEVYEIYFDTSVFKWTLARVFSNWL